MHIAILTFEGFNELDSLIALGILNRIKKPDWRVSIASPTARVRSMNGVVLEAQASLAEAVEADAVLVGSGMQTREVVADTALMAQLQFDPARQLVGAQCSGTLVLAKLGLLKDVPACTDLTTKPWVEEAGAAVLNQPFSPAAMWPPRAAASRRSTWPVGPLPAWRASRRLAVRCTTLHLWEKRSSTSSACCRT